MSTIYMYHGIGSGPEIEGADPFYAVSKENFVEQIELIGESQPVAHQLREDNSITHHCITFDDGHLSNYTIAFPELLSRNLFAEFYVNTDFIGTENYMTWENLKEMSDAGMSIQSHGHTHPYFSDLAEDEIREQLETSKKLIEEKVGTEVTVFAPPGGRYNKIVVQEAKKLGYRCIANSVPGVCVKNEAFEVPRFAILATTPNAAVKHYKRSNSYLVLKQRFKYHSFGLAKKLLGNKAYDKVRSAFLGGES